MGEVVRRRATPHDIFADVRTTLANATAKGGIWQQYAEERLAAVAASIESIESRVTEAERSVLPLQATLESAKAEADDALGRVSDEIWNAVGRPRTDASLAMLFPGGIAYYARGPLPDQPARMDLLATLLESGTHPRIPPSQATTHATTVRASAAVLRGALDAVSGPRAQRELLERVRRTVANTAQVELANLKRVYKSAHQSEAEIHAVIPDRPTPSKRGAVPPPPPQTNGVTPPEARLGA